MDNDNTIIPYKGVNTLALKESRHYYFKSFKNYTIEEFYKTPISKKTTLNILEIGVFIYFDENDLAEAIEFNNTLNLTFNELELFKLEYSLLLNEFRELDNHLKNDEYGFTSIKFGIGAYISDPNKSFVDSIIIFSKDYYN
ncbi:hypothetical protein [Algivirga pacifica]|uniref:Uncharacterized protein n=1 Tax=Algivirga pacifica TaxID=1162670 RepID=A0ABP9DG82_9BACT